MVVKIKSKVVLTTYYRLKGIGVGELEEKIIRESVENYDEAGRLIEKIRFLASGEPESTDKFLYNESGQLLEEQNYYSDNETVEKHIFEYAKDRLASEKHIFMDGSFHITTYIYDESNFLREKITVDDEGVYGNRILYNYVNGQMSEIITKGAEGEILAKETFQWDEKGNKIEITVMEAEQKPETVNNTFDEKNRLQKSVRKSGRETTETVYVYNDAELLVEENLYVSGKKNRSSRYTYNEHKLMAGIEESFTIPGYEAEQKLERKIEYEFY